MKGIWVLGNNNALTVTSTHYNSGWGADYFTIDDFTQEQEDDSYEYVFKISQDKSSIEIIEGNWGAELIFFYQ